MRKKVVVTSILGLIFLLGAVGFFMFAGDIGNNMRNGAGAIYAFQTHFANFDLVMKVFQSQFTNMGVMSYVNIGLAAILVVLLIVQFIMFCKKRHGVAFLEFLSALIGTFALFLFITISFVPGYFEATGTPFYSFGGYAVQAGVWQGFWGWILVLSTSNIIGIGELLIYFIPALLALIGFILMLVGFIGDMRYLASLTKPAKKQAPSEDEVFVIDDDQIESDTVAEAARENLQRNGGYQAETERRYEQPIPAAGIQGPLLIQYINTYSPGESSSVKAKGNVPISEIQSNINGDKPLTAEDIRKIIAEEMAEKKEPAPVIVSVPAPEKAAEEPRLTAEDVRAIFSEELGRYLAQDEEPYPDQDVVIEEDPAPEVLTADDVRRIIAEQLAASQPVEEEPAYEPQENVRDVVREELASFHAQQDRAKEEALAAKKAREEELAAAKAEAAEAARKETEAKYKEQPKTLSSEDIRKLIADEMNKAAPAPEPKPVEEKKDDAAVTAELIREIIRSELKDAAPVKEEKVAPVTVVIKEREEVSAPAPAPEPAPAPAVVVPVVVAPAPAPEKKEEPKPVVKEQRAVGEINPDLPPHDKIIRIPFPTRMVEGEKELKSNYNELKSEIMSYGVKSRVSNSGDTFRLHKVTFVKITVAGKGLKLYFALNPKDYANTTLPVQDAGDKGTYKDIPLVFKVKSELSMRRAKQLISDVMEKNGIEQGKIEPHNWANDLKDYKPAGSDKDDD